MTDVDLRCFAIDTVIKLLHGSTVSGAVVVAEATYIYQFLKVGPKPNKNNAAARKRNKRKKNQ